MSCDRDHPSRARRFAEWLYDRRHAALVLALMTAGLAVGPATTLEVDNTLRRYVVEGDPALDSYRRFQATYGNDEIVLVGLRRAEGLWTPHGIDLLRRATDRVRRVDGVAGVQSLTTQTRVQATLAGPRGQPLVPPGALSAEQVERLRRQVRSDTAWARFVSDDGTMAAIVARMPPPARLDGRRGAILDSIRHRLRPLDASIHLAGTGVILNALNEATTQDSALVLLAAVVVIVALLGAFFRRAGPVLVTMGIVCTAVLGLMGLYGATGKAVNTVTLVVPTLVLVVGTADCVHLLVYAAHCPDTLSGRERTVRTIAYLLFPCAVTTLTTAAGFAVLATSRIPIVQDLGLFSAIGVVGAFAAALVGCANALPHAWSRPRRPSDGPLAALVAATVQAGARRWRLVVAAGAGAVVLAGGGLAQLTVDTNSMDYLYPDHPVRQEARLIEETLGPYAPLEFVVRADSTVLRPSLLQAVRTWARRAEATGRVGGHRSAADVLHRLHREIGGPSAATARRLRGLLALGRTHSARLDELADHPGQLRVTFAVPMQSAKGLRTTIAGLKEQAAAALPSGVTAEATGYLPLYVRMTDLLVDAQLRSFGGALLVIPLTIAGLFGGLWAAGWSLVPNLLPVLCTLGAMGAVGIPLDIVTVTIAVIVFGLVVDDTVHLLHRYADARASQPPARALPVAARRVGRVMAITTTVLAGGFGVLALAHNRSVVWFGALIAGALCAALVVDLLLLPALLAAGQGDGEEARGPDTGKSGPAAP